MKPKKLRPAGKRRRPIDQRWSRPIPVNKFIVGGHCSCVYQLLAVRKGKRRPIARLLKTDRQGILYWGAAPAGFGRVNELVKSLLGTVKHPRHEVGVRYNGNRKLKKAFPLEQMSIRYCPIELPEDMLKEIARLQDQGIIITDMQEQLAEIHALTKTLKRPTRRDWMFAAAAFLFERSGFRTYEQEFGELPPLNRIGGTHSGEPMRDARRSSRNITLFKSHSGRGLSMGRKSYAKLRRLRKRTMRK